MIQCKKRTREFNNNYVKSKLLYKISSVENKLHLRKKTKK